MEAVWWVCVISMIIFKWECKNDHIFLWKFCIFIKLLGNMFFHDNRQDFDAVSSSNSK